MNEERTGKYNNNSKMSRMRDITIQIDKQYQ